MSKGTKILFDLFDLSNCRSSNYRTFLMRVLKGLKDLLDLDDFSNYMSSNYMSFTVFPKFDQTAYF